VAQADSIVPWPSERSERLKTIDSLVQGAASLYRANRRQEREAISIVECENPALDPTVQSQVVKKGKQENSWGLSQINLDSHPNILLQQAEDPQFSINFLVENIVKGNQDMWYTCHQKWLAGDG